MTAQIHNFPISKVYVPKPLPGPNEYEADEFTDLGREPLSWKESLLVLGVIAIIFLAVVAVFGVRG